MLKSLGGRTARRLAPRSIAALEEVARLRQEVDGLRDALEELRHRTGAELTELRTALEESRHRTGAELAELRTSIGEVGQGLQESRAQSLRVGQLTDLVFSRLADAGTTGDRPAVQSRA